LYVEIDDEIDRFSWSVNNRKRKSMRKRIVSCSLFLTD
jgi:hypothetical protein